MHRKQFPLLKSTVSVEGHLYLTAVLDVTPTLEYSYKKTFCIHLLIIRAFRQVAVRKWSMYIHHHYIIPSG